jgi:hypothetical protein
MTIPKTISHVFAATLLATAIGAGTAKAQPTLTPLTGPTCTGTNVYVLPHLSTEHDGDDDDQDSRFTSVVMIANLNPTTDATIQACGYNNGSFLGGTSFTLPVNNRLFAIDPPPEGTPAPGTMPVPLASLFNLTTLPDNIAFHAAIASNIPLAIESGFVGPRSHLFTIVRAGLAGTVLGSAHFGTMAIFPGTLFLSNPNNAAVTYNLTFYNDDGTVAAKTGDSSLAAFMGARLELSQLTDGSGNPLGLKNYYSLRVSATGGTLGGITFIRSIGNQLVGNAMAQIKP